MASPQKLETVRRIQRAMALGYSMYSIAQKVHNTIVIADSLVIATMGALVFLDPATVIKLSLTPTYAIVNRTTKLMMRCFAAQAMTSGLLLGMSPMDERSFTSFGLAMIPYLMFNGWFLLGSGRGVFTNWLLADFVGNVFFALGSAYCAKVLREENGCGKKSR